VGKGNTESFKRVLEKAGKITVWYSLRNYSEVASTFRKFVKKELVCLGELFSLFVQCKAEINDLWLYSKLRPSFAPGKLPYPQERTTLPGLCFVRVFVSWKIYIKYWRQCIASQRTSYFPTKVQQGLDNNPHPVYRLWAFLSAASFSWILYYTNIFTKYSCNSIPLYSTV